LQENPQGRASAPFQLPVRRLVAIAAGVCAAMFAFAFVAAPKSCEWGLTAYFWTGVVGLLALAAVPLVLGGQAPIGRRLLLGLGLLLGGFAVWFAGLVAANIQIMCRLF
jgi:hypothetical protein